MPLVINSFPQSLLDVCSVLLLVLDGGKREMKEIPFVFCLSWETGLLLTALLPDDLAVHEKSGMYVAG